MIGSMAGFNLHWEYEISRVIQMDKSRVINEKHCSFHYIMIRSDHHPTTVDTFPFYLCEFSGRPTSRVYSVIAQKH